MKCHEKDRHVLAVAVARKVDVIVTYNHRDFPEKSVKPHRIETVDPDRFVSDVIDLDPDVFLIWYHRMADARIQNAKQHGREAPTAVSIAEHLAKSAMPVTGKRIIDLLQDEQSE